MDSIVNFFGSLFGGQSQSLAGGIAALFAVIVVVGAIFFGATIIASRRQAVLSKRIDRQQEEVRADIGKLRTVIAEAISGKWSVMEARLSGAIGDAAKKLEQQQQQQSAKAAELMQQQNALLESIAERINESLQHLDERQQQNSETIAAAITKVETMQQSAATEHKKMIDDYGVYLHDQSAALTAAQERTITAAGEQLRQSAATLAQAEQHAQGFAERLAADINRRLDDMDRRVQMSVATFENLDNKLALLREVQAEVNNAGKDISALSQMLTLAAAAIGNKNG